VQITYATRAKTEEEKDYYYNGYDSFSPFKLVFVGSNVVYTGGSIADIACDWFGNLYIADNTAKQILVRMSETEKFSEIYNWEYAPDALN